MNIKFKKTQIAILFVLVFSPIFSYASAEQMGPLFELADIAETGGYASGISEYSLAQYIGVVISSFLSLLGIIFVVLMIYGGFKWMKATGREDEVGKAQDIIRNAIIGLIITASSYAIYSFVFASLLG